MTFLKRIAIGGLLAALLWAGAGTASAAEAPVSASVGEWTASLGPRGLALTYQGEVLSRGSYLTVYGPRYEGSVIGSRAAWQEGRAEVSEDGRTITLSAELPEGTFRYEAVLEEDRVRMTVRLRVAEDADVGPVEHVLAQIPEQVVAGGIIEVRNVAGAVTARLPLPEEPRQGDLTGRDPVLAFMTPSRTITIEAVDSGGTVHPFDARHGRYGERYGIWVFASPAVRAGEETVTTVELRVEPPAPERAPGTITIAPASPASVILTPPDATPRETLAADELAAYLQAITGRRLERGEFEGGAAPEGAILVGNAAVRAKLIARDELEAVAPDGYVVKVAGGRVGIAGPRDVGTVYGAYALLRHLGCRFYAPGCETVPETEALLVREVSLADSPFYELRNVTGSPFNGQLVVSEETFARRLAEFCEIGRAMRIAQFVRRLDTADWLHRVARIRPERSPWYADPLIERLIADPVGTLAALGD